MMAGSKFSSAKSLLCDDQRGVAALEFALIAPVLILAIMGTFDLGHTAYVRSVLEGELQSVGRGSTLESGSAATQRATLDANITRRIRSVAGTDATVTATRRAFDSYSRVQSRAETFIDSGKKPDGICNNGETFEDLNRDGRWSADASRDGQGGAKDAVVYTVTVSYPRLFPMAGLIGWSQNMQASATTILRNQPYNDQEAAPIGKCP